jgi:hypothetical protein
MEILTVLIGKPNRAGQTDALRLNQPRDDCENFLQGGSRQK